MRRNSAFIQLILCQMDDCYRYGVFDRCPFGFGVLWCLWCRSVLLMYVYIHIICIHIYIYIYIYESNTSIGFFFFSEFYFWKYLVGVQEESIYFHSFQDCESIVHIACPELL